MTLYDKSINELFAYPNAMNDKYEDYVNKLSEDNKFKELASLRRILDDHIDSILEHANNKHSYAVIKDVTEKIICTLQSISNDKLH